MSKPDSVPVPEANTQQQKQRSGGGLQAPNSGSKKTKQHNHVSHNNPQG
ncbi:small acid-soluble spore protein P [Paenibacillus sp. YIM B09110]